jgi:hypothetical protein
MAAHPNWRVAQDDEFSPAMLTRSATEARKGERSMPIKETLTAKPVTLADILSNGKRYLVPSFQRDYAWGEDEWRELWADLVLLNKASDELSNHYLGALVLQPTGQQSESRIIDGQQRLVTLIQLLVEREIEPADNRERIRLLQEKFVSTKDSASLQRQSRMRLNDHDNPFYETYLVQGNVPSRPAALRGSEAKLYGAYRYFDSEIEALLGPQASGSELARFLDGTVGLRLRFIEIEVADEETAFTVFETLNARGVALGTADLLKNFIFATANKGGKSDLGQAQTWWDEIVTLVPLDHVATFLFHRLSAVVPDLREKRVFSEVKQLVPRSQDVFEFLREMKDAAEIYSALDDPESDFWGEFAEARPAVRVLDLLRVDQCRPVILAAFRGFADKPEKLVRLLRHLVVISLRAKVARINTGDLQRAYQSAALRIERNELKSPLAIARALSGVNPSDDDFRSYFSQLTLDPKGPNKKMVRYLLVELEAAWGGQRIDFEGSDATIEHILPENPSSGWDAFPPQDRAPYLRRLGNLTLLEYEINRRLGSAPYDVKRERYAQSTFRMTRSIVQTEWSPAAVRARQMTMAEKAVGIWRIEDQPD